MISLLILLIFTTMISFFLILLNFIISKKMYQNREKSSPFECGFDPLSLNRLPLSIQFFMISLMFLIFDIEITLLIPLIFLSPNLNLSLLFTSLLFILFLILGLYLEYSEKSLDWKL